MGFQIEEVEAFAFLKILGEQQEEYMPTDRYRLYIGIADSTLLARV